MKVCEILVYVENFVFFLVRGLWTTTNYYVLTNCLCSEGNFCNHKFYL